MANRWVRCAWRKHTTIDRCVVLIFYVSESPNHERAQLRLVLSEARFMAIRQRPDLIEPELDELLDQVYMVPAWKRYSDRKILLDRVMGAITREFKGTPR